MPVGWLTDRVDPKHPGTAGRPYRDRKKAKRRRSGR